MKPHIRLVFRICAIIIFASTIYAKCSATHDISYRWKTRHVEIAYRDCVGTPIPPSYGFWALMQNLAHQKRLFESFMRSPAGSSIGNKLDVEISVFGFGGKPPGMVLKGKNVRAVIKPPFTDPRVMHALLEMSAGNSLELSGELSDYHTRRAKHALAAFPDDGFPVFSPSGSRLAFQSWRGDIVDVLIASPDGSQPIRIGGTAATKSVRSLAGTHSILGLPVWSPDERMIAYIADGKVVVGDLTRRTVRLITDCKNAITKVLWSPNGRMIAAIVSGADDDIYYMSDVLLLNPQTAKAVSLKNKLPVFKFGFFLTNLSWQPTSRVLAVVVGLEGVVFGASLSPEKMGNSNVYFVDAFSQNTRSIRLPGLYVDDGWSNDGKTWAVVVRARDKYMLLCISKENLRIKTIATSGKEMCILGIKDGYIFYLDGEKPMLANLSQGKAKPLGNVRVENIQLMPGIYGGYIGTSEDYTTENEEGEKIILIEDGSSQHYLLGASDSKVIEKEWGKVIITAPGTFPKGWLSRFSKENDLIHLDWSPKAKAFAASASQHGGLIEMLTAKPGGVPTNISRKLDSQAVRIFEVEQKDRSKSP